MKTIFVSDIRKCPLFILLPEHYREDGSCRCDEPTCEWDWEFRCPRPKFKKELYCIYHLKEMGEFDEDYLQELNGINSIADRI